ncbi:hypothetical protein NP493_854g01046 [Ridgeia piscesae]|uniref:Uncharacterized protein n=1 Tax=Ridgeia piscesae TaxID=27915 RepID=A0AAD9KN38_RIDPI|nr:hypothetical protein NP493_854g01046 [Ridgeia piscesae]
MHGHHKHNETSCRTEETRYFTLKECASAVHPAHNLISDRQYTVLATVQFPNIHSIVAIHEAPSSVSAILSSCASHKKKPPVLSTSAL